MRKLILSPQLLGFVVGTRAALGLGIGLLLAAKLSEARRKTLGLTLLAIGATTTIPAAMKVFGSQVPPADELVF